MSNNSQKGITHILVLVAAVGLIVFFLISSSAEFKNKLFPNLFPKPLSHAANPMEVKTMLIQFIPPGGVHSVYPGAPVADPASFTTNTLLPAMTNGTKYHGYSNPSAQAALNFTLAPEDTITVQAPPPMRPDNYLGSPPKAADQPGYLDMPAIFSTHNVCNIAKQKDIKFLVLYMADFGEYAPKGFESYVTGNKGIPTNGPILSGPEYCNDKTIMIVALAYTRGLSEALESYGHHLESVFRAFRSEYSSWADEGSPPNSGLVGKGDSCGTDHNPPNARFEYDRSNTADFQSDCRNWKPDGSGVKEAINCSAWGCAGDTWLVWWTQNMPGMDNNLIGTDGVKIPNWWVYIGDPDNCYNRALECSGIPTPSPTPQACTNLPPGLISYWNLDETGNNVSDSADSNHGTVVGTVGSVPGKIGNARSFNGTNSSNITIGDKDNLDLTNFTIAGWFQRTGACAFDTCPIFSKGQSASTGYSLEVSSADGRARLNIKDGLNVGIGSSVLSSNSWNHIAGTIDGSRIKVYVNGALDADVAQTQVPDFWNNIPARIGTRNSNADVTANGYIDELGVWNRALSASEIASLYNLGSGVTCLAPTPTSSPTPTPTPTPTPVPVSWVGQYYVYKSERSDRGLNGTPVLTRQDQEINFSWGSGSPAGGIPSNRFSAKWTKTENFEAGTYRFTTRHDDGMRIYLDGVRIYNRWDEQSARTRTLTRSITSGKHTLRVEYFENAGRAEAQVSWVKQ